MKKRILLAVAMVVIFALAAAGTAYATWADSTYATPAGNPHVSYSTATVKCAVCHAVHNAWNGEKLLKSTAANACNFCHLSTTSGYTYVYDGVAANYGPTNARNAHNNVTGGDYSSTVACKDCHAVHGAKTVSIGGTARNLKQFAANNAFAQVVTGDTRYLNYQIDSSATPALADLGQWCSGCHPYRNTALDGGSHVMRNFTTTYTINGSATYQVAWTTSANCTNCHDDSDYDNRTNAASGAEFPHKVDGDRFLINDAGNDVGVGNANQDGVCLKCHYGAGAGVGGGF